MEIVQERRSASLFSSGALRWGFWGSIEGLATFAEEGGLHGGGVLGWDGQDACKQIPEDDLFSVFLVSCLVLHFLCGFFFFVSVGFSFLFSFFPSSCVPGTGGSVGVVVISPCSPFGNR